MECTLTGRYPLRRRTRRLAEFQNIRLFSVLVYHCTSVDSFFFLCLSSSQTRASHASTFFLSCSHTVRLCMFTHPIYASPFLSRRDLSQCNNCLSLSLSPSRYLIYYFLWDRVGLSWTISETEPAILEFFKPSWPWRAETSWTITAIDSRNFLSPFSLLAQALEFTRRETQEALCGSLSRINASFPFVNVLGKLPGRAGFRREPSQSSSPLDAVNKVT